MSGLMKITGLRNFLFNEIDETSADLRNLTRIGATGVNSFSMLFCIWRRFINTITFYLVGEQIEKII